MKRLDFAQKAFQKERLMEVLSKHGLNSHRFAYNWSEMDCTFIASVDALRLYLSRYQSEPNFAFEELYISHDLVDLSPAQPSGFDAFLFGQRRNLLARVAPDEKTYLGVELSNRWIPVAQLRGNSLIHRVF